MAAVDTIISGRIAHGLQIRGIHSETHIPLHKACSRDFIPVDRSHIPTAKTALQWLRLRHLADKLSPLQDCELGLLIGYDCPLALAPLEVNRGPFAQKTKLGWSITGPSNPHLDRLGNQSFVHRVVVKEMPKPPATDVLKILESDFNEKGYEDKNVSQDDVRFIQLLSNNIQREDMHYEVPFMSSTPLSLPNNKRLAIVGLQNLKKKFKNNKQYCNHYKTFMEAIISRDDSLISVPSIKEAKDLITEAQRLCKRGGLCLHKLNSNKQEVLSCADPS